MWQVPPSRTSTAVDVETGANLQAGIRGRGPLPHIPHAWTWGWVDERAIQHRSLFIQNHGIKPPFIDMNHHENLGLAPLVWFPRFRSVGPSRQISDVMSTVTPCHVSDGHKWCPLVSHFLHQGLSMNTNIDSYFFIPRDPTSLYNMRVVEWLREDSGHMKQFQEKVMIGGDGMSC